MVMHSIDPFYDLVKRELSKYYANYTHVEVDFIYVNMHIFWGMALSIINESFAIYNLVRINS
jgi:hypothetical protein